MDNLDIIEYDQDRGSVVLSDSSRLEPYLSIVKEDDNKEIVLLGIAAAIGGIAALGAFGIGPLVVIAEAIWTGLLTATFFGVIAYVLFCR